MKNRVWHVGPPPHVGWWNASYGRKEDVWRWWDGKKWSLDLTSHEDAKTAGKVARIPDDYRPFWLLEDCEWTHYYPEDARVPRINPEAV